MDRTRSMIHPTSLLCECGCGEETEIAERTRPALGWIKGEPRPYVSGHAQRGRVNIAFDETCLRRLSEFELGWIVGILEGEGCFQLRRREQRQCVHGSITVSSTDKDVIERLHELLPDGTTCEVSRPAKLGHKRVWRFTLGKSVRVIELCELIRSMVSERRREAIDALLANIGGGRHGRG